MNEVSAGVVAITYGNVLAMVTASTGSVTQSTVVFSDASGLNSTKMSTFDPNTQTVWIQARNDPKSPKPCQYTFGYNVQTKKMSQSPCLAADRGSSGLIDGIWTNPSNSSYVLVLWTYVSCRVYPSIVTECLICFRSNILGSNVAYYNPVTGVYGDTVISFQEFVDHNIMLNGELNTYTYNPKRGVFQFLFTYSSGNNKGFDGIGTAVIPGGGMSATSPLGTSLTQEGYVGTVLVRSLHAHPNPQMATSNS